MSQECNNSRQVHFGPLRYSVAGLTNRLWPAQNHRKHGEPIQFPVNGKMPPSTVHKDSPCFRVFLGDGRNVPPDPSVGVKIAEEAKPTGDQGATAKPCIY